MAEITSDNVMERIIKALPYPGQMHHIDTTDKRGIRFDWRTIRWRVSVPGMCVEEVQDGILAGTNAAILMERLIKNA